MSCLIVQVRDMLRVEYVPRCNAMCAVCPVCLPQCVLAVALPGLSLTSPSCLKMSFTEIVKPLTAR